MIDLIKYKKKLFAIIIKSRKIKKNGTNFISPKNFTHQVGFINRPKGHLIKPHTHKNFTRKINKTSEVLFVKSGIIRVDFYSNKKTNPLNTLMNNNRSQILCYYHYRYFIYNR